MDPLSLTASIITIVGVGGNFAKMTRRLAIKKHAPGFFLVLQDEITNLRLVVLTIQDIYQASSRNRESQDADINATVTSTLAQAQRTVTEMQSLYDRISAPSSAHSGFTELKKALWLLDSKSARRVREDLRNVRLKLTAILGILNSYV